MAFLTDVFKVAGLVQSGRRALLKKDFASALSNFAQAAEKDPGYIVTAVHLREGVLTYLGRAQYAVGRWAQARQSFERALAAFSDDVLARLYLGAALVRGGDELRGVFELQKGLQALRDWIEDIRRARPFEDFWDPNGQIRGEIQRVLDLIARKRFDREQLLASVEWIGDTVEEEMDRVRWDETANISDAARVGDHRPFTDLLRSCYVAALEFNYQE